MDIFDIIISAISGGALITALTIPSAIKKARADARSAEAASKAAEIDNLNKVIEGWEKLSNERQEANESLHTQMQAKEAHIDTLNGKIDYLYSLNSDWRDKYNAKCEEVSSLKVKIATDEVKLCMVRGCKDREPQSGY